MLLLALRVTSGSVVPVTMMLLMAVVMVLCLVLPIRAAASLCCNKSRKGKTK